MLGGFWIPYNGYHLSALLPTAINGDGGAVPSTVSGYQNSPPQLVGTVSMSPAAGEEAFLSDEVSLTLSLSDPDGDAVRYGLNAGFNPSLKRVEIIYSKGSESFKRVQSFDELKRP